MKQTSALPPTHRPASPFVLRTFGPFFGLPLGLGLLVTLLGLVACDSGAPIAPAGTVLTISATPTRITLNGTSQIRVVARKPNGTPLNPGTIILFSTTIGTIPPSVALDDSGEVTTLLAGNGQFGMATVSASVGSADAVTIEIQVGLAAGSLTIQSSPASVSQQGGRLSLLALVRDDQGQPLADAQVNFRSEIGSLSSQGVLLATDDQGSVQDQLRVTEGDIDLIQGETFQVSAETASATGTLFSESATISIRRLPRPAFTFGVSGLSVVFTDTSQGNPTRWLWDFDDGNTSVLQNPTHTYSTAGTYAVRLTVTNSQGDASISQFVAVTGQ